MLPSQDAEGARSRRTTDAQVCYRRRDEDARTKRGRRHADKTTREAEGLGLNDPRLHRPQQVSILVGLVGEEASMSVVRGGARRLHETEQHIVKVQPIHQLLLQSRLNLVIVLL